MYGKLFESTFTGSMVGSGPVVFSVWAYVIAHIKPPGIVELNPLLLAPILGCNQTEVEQAIDNLSSPDPRSRSPEHEGRRLIREGQFFYSVPTWKRYNSIRNEDERRAYNRDAQRRSRLKRKGVNRDINDCQHPSAAVSRGQPLYSEDVPVPEDVPERREERRASALTDRERPEPEADRKQQKPKPVSRPSDVSEQVWQDWLIHRKAKRATVTTTVLSGLRKEAERAGLTLEQVLATCAQNGWQGFKAEWLANVNQNGQPQSAIPGLNKPNAYRTKFSEVDYRKGGPTIQKL